MWAYGGPMDQLCGSILNLTVKNRAGFYPRGRMDMHRALGLPHSTASRSECNKKPSKVRQPRRATRTRHGPRNTILQAPSPKRNPKAKQEHDQQCARNKHRHSERSMFLRPCDAIQRNA